MKFDAVDTVTNRTWFDGECDGDEITSITPKVGIAKVLLNRAGDPTSLSALSSKFPRLQIGLDEESVGEGEIVKLDPVRKQVFGWFGEVHTPVVTPIEPGSASVYYSWGHYHMGYLFAPTAEAFLEKAITWAEEREAADRKGPSLADRKHVSTDG